MQPGISKRGEERRRRRERGEEEEEGTCAHDPMRIRRKEELARRVDLDDAALASMKTMTVGDREGKSPSRG